MKSLYKKVALELAEKAGKTMLAYFTLGMKKNWKEDNTPVTAADIEINKLVIKTIRKNFPDHDVLGEELSDMKRGSEMVWVCDPIDGTIPFSHGIPTSTFSLALVWRGKPIMGVVYDPFLKRMFFAEKGGGAFLCSKRIYVNSKKELRSSLVGMEVWREAQFNLSPLQIAMKNEGAKIIIPCSTAYMGMLVACGEASASIFPGSTAHDGAVKRTLFFRQSFDDFFADFFHFTTPLTARQTRLAAS